MDPIAQRLRVVNRWRVDPRRLDRIVNDEHHVGRLGAQPALGHHRARPDHGDWNDGQPRFDCEQEASSFEARDAAIAAARAFRKDNQR